ncbi:carbon-nitrogen hydrolase family protein [Winogradskyella poriferorum]|uniref:carbon-nitrogen hydrolase family protein n=1 Tax=Winogradskyella poriferorum TaxID=307627 RepID=UPI003D65399E
MNICLAQSKSFKGDIAKNITHHLYLIDKAIENCSDLIVFPELSITGYEPSLAKTLATNANDVRFKVFQDKADQHQITIAIGVPLTAEKGITISLVFYRPHTHPIVYAKQKLHDDELPYFVQGQKNPLAKINNKVIAFGICYETMFCEPFEEAICNNSDAYIASVAKPMHDISRATTHYSTMAKTHGIPVLMCNSIGPSEDFFCAGQSAIWDKTGKSLGTLDASHEGLLIFHLDNNTTTSIILSDENKIIQG